MRINGKSVKGICSYSEEVQFEKGDFVVDGSIIYIAKTDVMGKKPSDYNELYSIYLGENIADLEGEDFASYIKGAGQDKLVTAYSVGKILNSFISGFDEKGIISNEITKDQIAYVRDYFGNETTILARTNPLDAIMAAPDLNNCVFKVDRHVVQDLFGTSQLNFTSNYIILRQYTYLDTEASPAGPALYIRVQELADEETGLLKWRYSTSNDNYDSSIDWNSVNVNEDILETIDEIINYYRNKAVSFEKEKVAMKANFSFIEIPFTYSNTSGQLEIPSEDFPGLIKSSTEIAEKYPITISVRNQLSGSSIYETGSVTVDIGKLIKNGQGSFETYRVTGRTDLKVTYSGSNIVFNTTVGDVINIYARNSVENAYNIKDSNSMKVSLNCIDTNLGQNTSSFSEGHTYIIPLTEEMKSGTLILNTVQQRFEYTTADKWGGELDTFQLSIPISDIYVVPDSELLSTNRGYITNESGISDGTITWLSTIKKNNRFNVMLFISKCPEFSDRGLISSGTEYICLIPTKYNPYEDATSTTYRVVPGAFDTRKVTSEEEMQEAISTMDSVKQNMICAINTDEVYCLL